MIGIRPGSVADVPAIMEVVVAVIAHMRDARIEQWDEVYPDRDTFTRDALEATLFVAAEDSTIAGVYVLNEFQNIEYADVPWTIDVAPIAVLHRLLVHPRFQRQGVATMMVEDAERRAAEAGYAAIRLDAFTQNPAALRLYQRHGYHDAGAVTLRKGVFRVFEKAIGGRSQ